MGRLLISVVSVAMAATACTTQAPGQAVPGPGDGNTPRSTSQSRTGEAPPINSPELDLAKHASRMCDLLTPEQLALFAIRDPGKPSNQATGPDCTWNPPDTTAGATLSVGILTQVTDGLEGMYARKDQYKFFENAGEINGYPAIHRDSTSDGTKGICATVVGVRRDLVFEAVVLVNVRSSPEYSKPCALSDKAASSVIDTVRGGR